MSGHFAALRLVVWGGFAAWTLAALLLYGAEIGAVEIEAGIANRGLKSALLTLNAGFDATWFTLAAGSTYLAAASVFGLAATRKLAGLVLLGVVLVAASSALVSVPLGEIRYTGRLGWRMANLIPFALPLLWLAVFLASAILVTRRVFTNRWTAPAIIGGITLLTSFNLEFVGRSIRAWWIWFGDSGAPATTAPLAGYLVWPLLFALIAAIALPKRAASSPSATVLSAGVLLGLNLVFLLPRMHL